MGAGGPFLLCCGLEKGPVVKSPPVVGFPGEAATPAMWPSLLVSLAPRPAITVAVLLLHVAVLAPQVDG